MRVLLNYLARTRSKLILFPLVESEVTAHFRREFQASAKDVAQALRDATRRGLDDVPSFNPDLAAKQTYDKWFTDFTAALKALSVERPPLDGSILPEAVRRATERIPPCDSSGRELRDTILWLSLLSYCGALSSSDQVAFVSSNTKDFAAPDTGELRPELRVDLQSLSCSIIYFDSLDAFNKAHADRLAYLTVEWVQKHLGTETIEQLVTFRVQQVKPSSYFRVSSTDYEDYYEPVEVVEVNSANVTITDVYVWVLGDYPEVRIEFDVDIEATAECVLAERPSSFWHRTYGDDLDEDFPSSKTLTSYAQLSGVVSAYVPDEDAIEILDLEELEGR